MIFHINKYNFLLYNFPIFFFFSTLIFNCVSNNSDGNFTFESSLSVGMQQFHLKIYKNLQKAFATSVI